MRSAGWTAFTISYMCVFAYVISMIVYQLGGLLTGEATFSVFTVLAALLLATILFLLFRKGAAKGEDALAGHAVDKV